MKIEVLPKHLNDQVCGQHVKEDKLKELLKECVSKIVINKCANGSETDPAMNNLMTLVIACQMLWNELEDVKEELTKAKADIDDAFERGYNEGSLETEREYSEREGMEA